MQVTATSEADFEAMMDAVDDASVLVEMAGLVGRLQVPWSFTPEAIWEKLFSPALEALNLNRETRSAFANRIIVALGVLRVMN